MATFSSPVKVIELEPECHKKQTTRRFPQNIVHTSACWGPYVVDTTGEVISDIQIPVGTVCFIAFSVRALYPAEVFDECEPIMKLTGRQFLTRVGITDFYGSTKVIVPLDPDGYVK